jgi:hypothetical protein
MASSLAMGGTLRHLRDLFGDGTVSARRNDTRTAGIHARIHDIEARSPRRLVAGGSHAAAPFLARPAADRRRRGPHHHEQVLTYRRVREPVPSRRLGAGAEDRSHRHSEGPRFGRLALEGVS